MKTLKLSLTGIVVLVVLVGVIAFKPSQITKFTESQKQEASIVGQWYIYTGSSAGLYSALNPSNYRPLSVAENVNTLCSGFQTLCAIYAEPNSLSPSQPLITMTEPIYSRLVEYYTYGIWSPVNIKLKNY